MSDTLLQPVSVATQQVSNMEVKAPEAPVDPSVIELSTGVLVRFNDIPNTIAQEIVTSIFEDTQLKADGTIRENLSQTEQLALASAMMDLNSALISAGGVELVSDLPNSEDWLDKHLLNPVVMRKHPRLDLTKHTHIVFLYLRYEAFNTEEDWALLSQNTIGQ